MLGSLALLMTQGQGGGCGLCAAHPPLTCDIRQRLKPTVNLSRASVWVSFLEQTG